MAERPDYHALTVSLTEAAVSHAKSIGADRIDKVLLVGGATFMPKVKARIPAMGFAPAVHARPGLAAGLGAAGSP